MTDAESKDKILEYCLSKNGKAVGLSTLRTDVLQSSHQDAISLLLVEISKFSGNVANVHDKDSISSNGITKTFLKKGGFTEIERQKIIKLKNIERREKAELKNLEWSTKVSKFQVKTKWWPYFLSGVSLIIAVLAYFKPLNKIDQRQLSKDELIHITDSISISNQTKRVDSLHNSKTHADSLKTN